MASINDRYIEWEGGREQRAVDLLLQGGKMLVTPTKVGYIIMTIDVGGLKRKFESKQRAPTKAGVVLFVSLQQLHHPAEIQD